MPHPIFRPPTPRPPTRDEPVAVYHRKPPENAIIESHRHDWGQFVFPVKGGLRVLGGKVGWIVPVFRAVWLPPGIDHATVMLGAVQFYVAYIDPSVAPLPLDGCKVVEVSALMRELMLRLGALERPNPLMVSLLLEEIATARPLSLGLPMPDDARLQALCKALMDEPASPLSLREWAPRVGASERTLARLFQTELGTSYAAWRQQLRLAHAVDLMGRGLPLADVAAEVGYDSPSAFSTMFKRALGVPPSRFTVAPE